MPCLPFHHHRVFAGQLTGFALTLLLTRSDLGCFVNLLSICANVPVYPDYYPYNLPIVSRSVLFRHIPVANREKLSGWEIANIALQGV